MFLISAFQIIGALSERAQQMRPPWKAAFTGADPRVDGQADSVRGGRRVRLVAKRPSPVPACVEGHVGVGREQTTLRVCVQLCQASVLPKAPVCTRVARIGSVSGDGRRACTQVPHCGLGTRRTLGKEGVGVHAQCDAWAC